MMSADDARRPVWGDGSDLWNPISDDIRVGDWLDFMSFLAGIPRVLCARRNRYPPFNNYAII